MYVNTQSIEIDYYNNISINCPPYSKILNVNIKNNKLIIIFSTETYFEYNHSNNSKTFKFKILTGLNQSNQLVSSEFKYFKTVKVFENDYIEYYHVFIDEIKGIDEMRNDLIDNLID